MTALRGDDGVTIKRFDDASLYCTFVGGPIEGQVRRFPGGKLCTVLATCDDGLVRNAEYAYEPVIEHNVRVGWKAMFCAYSR